MRLVRITGPVWELTQLQLPTYGDDNESHTEEELVEKNQRCLRGESWNRGRTRPIANFGVKSKAAAVIETEVDGMKRESEYDIYINSKGFFSKVRGQRVYLVDLPQKE